MKIIELKQKRAKIVEDQRSILNKAEAEKRGMTADEVTQYEAMEKDFDRLTDDIAREEKLQQRELDMAALEIERRKREEAEAAAAGKPPGNGPEQPVGKRASKEYGQAFNSLLVNGGLRGINPDEYRALQADSATAGGFVIVPQQFMTSFIQAVDNEVFIRGLATVIQVPTAASLGVPSLDSDPDDAAWTSEIKTGTDDTGMTFGKRELYPHPLAKRIKVSNKLIRQAPQNIEALVRSRLAYKHAIPQENAYLNGSGSNQPLGVFTASTMGISTGRDVSTGNTATNLSADNLIECKYTLKPQYHKTARWIFHREAIKRVRKLKDGNGDYLWKVGLTDKPDTILEIPYSMSEYAPSTFTTGLYVGILGDFKHYWIADALDMQIQVLDQLYAETNQTGYIGRLESDGMPVLEEAFVRVKLG